MIKQIAVKNFRNLKDEVFDLRGQCSIIKGRNGLGKSNLLNAINWLLTDTLLTDNYGKGENDIESIVPNDFEKGQHTEVTITLDSGTTFTKLYKTAFDRKTKKVNGHRTEFKINDVAKDNAKDFYKELYKQVNFVEVFDSLKISEPRLFTDPLYALQKLDGKELRKLLVAMGCSVTNEELYKAGFEDMRKYETQYFGEWDTMRKHLVKQRDTLGKQLNTAEIQLEDYANVEAFDEVAYNALLAQRDEIVSKKNSLHVGNNEETIKIEAEIKTKNLELANKMNEAKAEIQNEINLLEASKKHLLDDAKHTNDEATNSIRLDIASIEKTKAEIQSEINSANATINQYTRDRESFKAQAKDKQNTKNTYAQKLVEVESRMFAGYVTCPNCGEVFAPNPDDLARFEADKARDVNWYRDQIDSLSNAISEFKSNFMECNAEIDHATILLDDANKRMAEVDEQLKNRKNDLATIPTFTADTKEVDEKIAEARNRLYSVSTLYSTDFDAISQLESKLKALVNSDEAELEKHKSILEEQLKPIMDELEKHVSIKVKNQEKAAKTKTRDEVLKKYNDNDSLLARCNELIHEMIKRINSKAQEKTGLEFVMLEENISNENLTETCYVVVDGIPFKDVNTARKVIIGCQFIEACKRIAHEDFNAPVNDLPILADRLEGIDDEEKIRFLSYSQIICTRVATNDCITID